MEDLLQIYKKLYQVYGKQGWWPLSKGSLHSKHHNGSPKTDKDKFEIMVGAILTQNTAWINVEKALYNLNKEKILDVNKIKEIEINHLASLIKPSGYYNMKAKKLKNLTEFVLSFPSLDALSQEKDLRNTILSINGVGDETADSILLYAFEKPFFVIDAYTKRIFSRLLGKEFNSYQEWQEFFMQSLEKDTEMFKEYHALIVEHAKKYCNTKPKCENCILKVNCKNFKSLE